MSPTVLRLAVLRKEAGLTQAELAAKAGVRQATISDYETGKVQNVHLSTLDRLAAALGCEPGDLLERVRRPKSK